MQGGIDMEDLALFYRTLVSWLGSYFSAMRSSWLTQIIIFIPVLAGIVAVLQTWRGNK